MAPLAVVALEKKVALLEQRLVLMERFVERRFSETFGDFSTRNLSASSSTNLLSAADKVIERPTTRSSVSGKRRVPSAADEEEIPIANPIAASSSSTGMRELRIRVIRMGDENGGDQEDNLEETQTIEAQPHLVKILREEDEVNIVEETGGDQDKDDYFMFSGGEVDAAGGGDEVDDSLSSDANAVDSDDQDWNEPPKKKRRSKTRLRPPPSELLPGGIVHFDGKYSTNLLECPECHSHWKSEKNYEKHLENCKKERPLKCKFENCGKGFFSKKSLRNHEKLHEKDKWAKMCRVGGGCEKKMVSAGHLLEHERICIRRMLGKGGTVPEEILEDVKRRSQNFEVDLEKMVTPKARGRKGDDGKVELKSCRYCDEKVEKKGFFKHLDKHRMWTCGLCKMGGDGGGDQEGEEDGEGAKGGFVEKKSLVRHLIRMHGLSAKKAKDKVVEEGGEVVVEGMEEQGGGRMEEQGGGR